MSYNPWQGQGTVIDNGAGYSAPEDAPKRSVWDWWELIPGDVDSV